MIMAVLLVMCGAYLSRIVPEKRAMDTARFVLQSLGLAEAGANQAVAELRKRIRGDLEDAVKEETNSNVYNDYVENNQSLEFLRDFAYTAGNIQFLVEGGQATLSLSNPNLGTSIAGSYNATITVNKNGEPSHPSQTDTYIFPYKYTIESTGSITSFSPPFNKTVKLLQGAFTVTVRRETFAKYALFTNHHRMPSGTTVWFTANTNFTGPLHTNERFSFANNPSGNFTAEVTQHLTTARFYNQGWPRLLNADNNPPNDMPVFQAGFSRGVAEINLPSSVTQQDLKKQATGDQNDGPWSSGIYLPNEAGALKGGIYIKGNAGNLTMSVNGNNQPVYTITQGSNIKSITVDYVNNQTIVANVLGEGGTPPGNYSDIPNGITNEGIIIYGNGGIGNFSGTVHPKTTAPSTPITVSSDSDITISNHIIYQNYTVGPPPSALPESNLLGILTWNGNVRIGASAPNNLNIHGIIMASGGTGIFTVDNYASGSPRGTVTLLGGAITGFYGPFGTFSGSTPISGYGRNFVYDTRMLAGDTPPYFPITGLFTSSENQDAQGIKDLDKRLIWQDTGAGD